MNEWVGTTLGGYRVEEEIGMGSMASVFRALRPDGRPVALKLFHGFLRGNDRMLRRFRRESQLLASLVHPRIIGFQGYFEADDALYYVMDFVTWPTVERLLEAGPLAPGECAVVTDGMLEALAFAHEKAVVHRDLKPSNLFYDRATGGVLLSDFGLAKNLMDTPITAIGTKMMGTPNYMAPEQVEGEETTVRTDVYQAGLVVYELFTAALPFRAKNPFEAISMRLKKDLPLDTEPGIRIPDAWQGWLRRACARDPYDRFASAKAARSALPA